MRLTNFWPPSEKQFVSSKLNLLVNSEDFHRQNVEAQVIGTVRFATHQFRALPQNHWSCLMDQDNSSTISSVITSLGGKAWTAYVRVALIAAVLLLFLTPLIWMFSSALGVVSLLVSIAFLTYQVLVVKSFHLYFDDVGVWVFAGVLPWNKGVSGVKWRDLDEAVYFQSMGSWLLKSYSIRIGHRFTKTSEIVLSHWGRGNEAVMKINAQHEALVRDGAIK